MPKLIVLTLLLLEKKLKALKVLAPRFIVPPVRVNVPADEV